MPRTVVDPEGLDFDRPGRRDYFVKLEHTTLWAHHLIPVTVWVGPRAEKGRGILATASTHGDEMEGPAALKRLLREIRPEDVLGRLVLVPVLNVMAFRANRRDTPDDGVNLNRTFPGDPRGSVTYRLADFVTRVLFPQAHVVLDLHSGGEVARFPETANVHWMKDPVQRRTMEETARGFGTRFVMVYQNKTPGLLTGLAEDLGKISVGTELGWGRAIQTGGASMGRQGVLNAAIREGQLRGEPLDLNVRAGDQLLVDTSHPDSNHLAPWDGVFEPAVALGEAVKKGQRVAWLHDFNRIDDPPLELTAAHDGHVICQAWNARVVQGQVVTQIGRVLEWTR